MTGVQTCALPIYMLEVFPVSELSVFGVVREFVNSSHFMRVKLKGVFGRGI